MSAWIITRKTIIYLNIEYYYNIKNQNSSGDYIDGIVCLWPID